MAKPTLDEIRQFVEAHINDPAAIAKRAVETGVTLADLAEATGYSPADITAYFQQAGVQPPKAAPLGVQTPPGPKTPLPGKGVANALTPEEIEQFIRNNKGRPGFDPVAFRNSQQAGVQSPGSTPLTPGLGGSGTAGPTPDYSNLPQNITSVGLSDADYQAFLAQQSGAGAETKAAPLGVQTQPGQQFPQSWDESGMPVWGNSPQAGQEYTFTGTDGQTYFVSADRSTNDLGQVGSWKDKLGFDPSPFVAQGPNGDIGVRYDIAEKIAKVSPGNQEGWLDKLATFAPIILGGAFMSAALGGALPGGAGGAMDVGMSSVLPAEWVQDAAVFGGLEGAGGAVPWGAGAEFVIPPEFYPPGSFPEGGLFPAIPPNITTPPTPPTSPNTTNTGTPKPLPPITPEYANKAIGPNTTGVDAYGNPLTPLPDLSGQVNPNLPGTAVNPLPLAGAATGAAAAATTGAATGAAKGLTGIDWLDKLLPLGAGLLGYLDAKNVPSTTTTVQDIPDWQKPYVMEGMGGAQAAYRQNQGKTYPIADQAMSMLGDTIGGKYLTPDSNPFLKSTFDAVTAATLPGLNTTFSRAGRTGSPAHERYVTEGLVNAYAPIAFGQYGAERGRQMQAGLAAPGMAKDMGQLPFQNATNYLNLVGQPFGRTQTSPNYTNPFGAGLSAALTTGALQRLLG